MRALFVAALCVCAAAFSHLSDHSFEPPFTDFSRDGLRQIDNWQYGSSAVVREHFIRLTQAKAGQHGFLFNKKKVLADSWSATLRFRVSGKDRTLFGDGLGLFFTKHASFHAGSLHGFSENFEGFAVILDTYRNEGSGLVHKDILLLSSDGSHPISASHGGTSDAAAVGCDANFRFWEGRQDFEPARNRSAVRVAYNGTDNVVSVYIDERGDGAWRTCIDRAPIKARRDFWRPDAAHPSGLASPASGGAYMALSASTGDLADNHDVLSFTVGLEDMPAPEPGDIALAAAGVGGVTATITSGNEAVDEAIRSAVSREAAKVNERILYIHHHLEHAQAETSEALKTALTKLTAQEALLEARVTDIERKLAASLDKKLNQVTNDVASQVYDKVGSHVEASVDDHVARKVESSLAERIARIESALASRLEGRLDGKLASEVMPSVDTKLAAATAASSRSWWLPVAALAVLMMACGAAGYRRLRHVEKRHLL